MQLRCISLFDIFAYLSWTSLTKLFRSGNSSALDLGNLGVGLFLGEVDSGMNIGLESNLRFDRFSDGLSFG